MITFFKISLLLLTTIITFYATPSFASEELHHDSHHRGHHHESHAESGARRDTSEEKHRSTGEKASFEDAAHDAGTSEEMLDDAMPVHDSGTSEEHATPEPIHDDESGSVDADGGMQPRKHKGENGENTEENDTYGDDDLYLYSTQHGKVVMLEVDKNATGPKKKLQQVTDFVNPSETTRNKHFFPGWKELRDKTGFVLPKLEQRRIF